MTSNPSPRPLEPADPIVSVVIPTLCGGSMFATALRSIREQRVGSEIEVIIVAGVPEAESVQEAVRENPVTRVVCAGPDPGFAPACNVGAAQATGRYLLFLNDDAVLPEGGLAALLADAAEGCRQAALWQPVIVSASDGTIESAGHQFTRAGFLWHLSSPVDDRPYPVFAAKGVCLLARRAVFEALGGFHPSYGSYFEESDLCWRARMAGWEARVVPGVRVRHDGGTTTRRTFTPAHAYHLGYRNRLRSILANTSLGALLRILPLHFAACLGIASAFAARGRVPEALALLAALVWPVTHLADLRVQRRVVQAARRLPDTEVFAPHVVVKLTPARARVLLRGNLSRW